MRVTLPASALLGALVLGTGVVEACGSSPTATSDAERGGPGNATGGGGQGGSAQGGGAGPTEDAARGPTVFRLTDDQRRQYLAYYAPLLLKSADEGSADHYGFDWLTNFDFDRDGQFKTNKANWERVDSYVANPGAPEFASWQIRPTMYTALLEFREGADKSVVLLYHVYHAKEEHSVHDWERIEVRVDKVGGTPGAAGEDVAYVVVTEHGHHRGRLPSGDTLHFMETPTGKHPIIWQAEWSESLTGFYRAELHFVTNTWTTLHGWNATCGSCNAEVDLNGTSNQKDVHYAFVPDGDPAAVAYWQATPLTHANAAANAAKTTGTFGSWSQVKRITYELQDLADILPTHANCGACNGAAPCVTEQGLQTYAGHWTSPTVGIALDEPIRAENGTELVPSTTTCGKPVLFHRGSLDVEDTTDGAEGYPHKHWFWGAYRMDAEGEMSHAFAGGAFVHPVTGVAETRKCPGGAGAFLCQHDYFAHEGPIGSKSGDTLYEHGRWLPEGWSKPENGGFDGRWVQLFSDRP